MVTVLISTGIKLLNFISAMKRGRGRPRRYPPPGQSNTSSSIPAVILPGANGQTLVMAPIQVCDVYSSPCCTFPVRCNIIFLY